ncbi:transcriptional regulator [Halobacteroides halobius DSM 5150]|uniref:Transcriptional regulator n=1 Tax=Halobacteroides halobius (strain ATCC 35273 / DSM 5150 / MD-1) TaxID=748449 RepID=L0KAJ2_HALHC|nr:LacI family DNA-binding transcriptional regulator [Halobacteroides halobius]AGB41379.1 transcriptional regulator [Halobacteroides halobius DSM 5150]
MAKQVTIRDVADYVGVSVATVSNVLNENQHKVSQKTYQEVLEAIEKLGYYPNFTARTLANRKSHLIGIMLPLVEQDKANTLLQDNPFYSQFISGIEMKTREKDYDILITGVGPEESCKDWIIKRNLDGIIFLGVYPNLLSKKIEEIDVPIVLTDTYKDYTGQFHNIGVNDQQGGYLATEYLLKLDHRNIAFVTGNRDLSEVNYRRYQGYQKALKRYNITENEELVYETEVSFEGGYKVGAELLSDQNDISAVFAVADILAFGIIKAFQEHDKKIPEDLSIVGFDDLKTCQYVTPALTTIKQDIFYKGVRTVEVLIEEIESQAKEKKSITLPLELVIRDSTQQRKD